MNAHRVIRTASRDQGGFALLVLLGLIGVGSLGILIAAERFVPVLAEIPTRTEHNLAVSQHAARVAFRRNGAFPTNLNGLATAAGLDTNGAWRLDPWAPPNNLDWQRPATGATLRSRGIDRRLGTADDLQATVFAEDLVRARQRGRLRMLRAVLLRSPYCDAVTMSTANRDAMRAAMQQQAIARRSWATADAAARVALQATLTSSAATVAALRATHSCPPIPNRMVGAGGLMQGLGLPDSRCTDGIGRRFLRDATLGVVGAGYDRRGGTDDDM